MTTTARTCEVELNARARELVAVAVEPELRGPVLALHENGGGVPVVPFAREVVAAFE